MILVSCSSVYVLSVANADDFNDQPVFDDFINHAVIPDADPVTIFRTDQFFDSVRVWVLG